MVIYIPKHLEKIPILHELSRMVKEYTANNSTPSFEDYHEYLAKDPIKAFISFCLDNNNSLIDDKINDKESIINYLVGLFYSIKGTPLVFDYMEKYLGINFERNSNSLIDYTVSELRFTINSVSADSFQQYSDRLKEFLSSLLYCGDVISDIKLIELTFDDSIEISSITGLLKYKEFIAIPINFE